jgi:hypothetical protein
MCQGEAEKLSNSSEHCQVQKVASLLAQALICYPLAVWAHGERLQDCKKLMSSSEKDLWLLLWAHSAQGVSPDRG